IRLSGADPPREEPLAGKFVLIADNNLPNRRYIGMLCEELGLDISEAADGSEALMQWQDLRPEFVILDARMPLLDGAACAQQIRAVEKPGEHCRIVAASAHLEPEERAAFLAAGADAILIKPFTSEQLLHALMPTRQEQPPAVSEMLTSDPEMLQLLAEELPKQYAELEEALRQADTRAARDAAHQLHGTAAFYHLAELKRACANLERKLAGAGPAALPLPGADAVKQILQQTLATLAARKP
ncbi:MAG TPA: response regulator, partial [Nevskiaceae bacterium]|nr:response regulator [Nevskiaceae bacterium]